jgi:hypothetical protein
LVGCTSQQPDGFLPLRAFKPLSSESADRGRSIIQVIILLEFSKIKYRNQIPEPGTTISGFVDNKKKKKINPDRP